MNFLELVNKILFVINIRNLFKTLNKLTNKLNFRIHYKLLFVKDFNLKII